MRWMLKCASAMVVMKWSAVSPRIRRMRGSTTLPDLALKSSLRDSTLPTAESGGKCFAVSPAAAHRALTELGKAGVLRRTEDQKGGLFCWTADKHLALVPLTERSGRLGSADTRDRRSRRGHPRPAVELVGELHARGEPGSERELDSARVECTRHGPQSTRERYPFVMSQSTCAARVFGVALVMGALLGAVLAFVIVLASLRSAPSAIPDGESWVGSIMVSSVAALVGGVAGAITGAVSWSVAAGALLLIKSA